MAIFDCFQFFNEEHILDLRFNILNKFVNFFVIVESTSDHQGKEKKLNFDINKFKKFKDKINYIVVDDTPENIKKPHEGGESLVEQHQRNSIIKGLNYANDDDLIILSDVDEIPDLNKLNEYDKKNYAVFSQRMFMYKLNFLNLKENNWHGSKICLKKNLKSPQWLRNIKTKKRSFWKIFKDKEPQIIKDAGWHFSFLKKPTSIKRKIISYSHQEFNKEEFINEKNIEKKIKKGEDLFNRNIKYKAIKIDESFPKYILENKEYFKSWII